MKFSLVIIMPTAVIFQAPTRCQIMVCVVSFYLHDSLRVGVIIPCHLSRVGVLEHRLFM